MTAFGQASYKVIAAGKKKISLVNLVIWKPKKCSAADDCSLQKKLRFYFVSWLDLFTSAIYVSIFIILLTFLYFIWLLSFTWDAVSSQNSNMIKGREFWYLSTHPFWWLTVRLCPNLDLDVRQRGPYQSNPVVPAFRNMLHPTSLCVPILKHIDSIKCWRFDDVWLSSKCITRQNTVIYFNSPTHCKVFINRICSHLFITRPD